MNNNKKKFDFKELFAKIKAFCIKNAKILAIIGTIIVVLIVIFLIVFRKRIEKFALNDHYNFYPEEVKALYANMVDVSCNGDLHLDISVDSGKTLATDLNKKNIIDYLISYLDKQGTLNTNSVNMHVVNEAQKKLFYDQIDLSSELSKYEIGGYEYALNGDKLVRKKKKECEEGIKHITYLYGYFSHDNELSVDVNVAYLKDGKLYDYDDKELGAYDGDVSKLQELTASTSYYRFYFIKVNGENKLWGVEWKHRA